MLFTSHGSTPQPTMDMKRTPMKTNIAPMVAVTSFMFAPLFKHTTFCLARRHCPQSGQRKGGIVFRQMNRHTTESRRIYCECTAQRDAQFPRAVSQRQRRQATLQNAGACQNLSGGTLQICKAEFGMMGGWTEKNVLNSGECDTA